jgi:hypothetical protein
MCNILLDRTFFVICTLKKKTQQMKSWSWQEVYFVHVKGNQRRDIGNTLSGVSKIVKAFQIIFFKLMNASWIYNSNYHL